ncbi:MAG: DNA repair protein RecN [Pseudomonadota bacterium]
MISALSISNFVLINRLDLETGPGFTGLTGETGAGKSILLDALSLIVGGRPEKRFVRAGADQATIIAVFEPPATHIIWQMLGHAGIACDPADALIVKRVIPATGAARGYVNDQPVSSSLLTALGACLVEIYGQHASAHLMRPSRHLEILDRYAGNERLLAVYGVAWDRLKSAKAMREAIETETEAALLVHEDLMRDAADLTALAPAVGETAELAVRRQQLSQSGKVRDAVNDVTDMFTTAELLERVGWASGALQRLTRLQGFDRSASAGGAGSLLHDTIEAFERASIELTEAAMALERLAASVEGDDDELERVEGRLFALRAAARKHAVPPDDLPELLKTIEQSLALAQAGSERLEDARREEADAAAQWRSAADNLSRARKAAAKRLEKAIKRELVPLKLEKAALRFRFEILPETDADGRGLDHVMIEVETNPGAGFGPLHKIASGGELARVSLALKCAAAEAMESPAVLVFDEADHGVGGAVAAAIGQRFQALARRHQVFAVTHSPQVAASAEAHWRIEKLSRGKSLGQMRASVLDPDERTEEIARMLSGTKITKEARAAAQRLLEG